MSRLRVMLIPVLIAAVAVASGGLLPPANWVAGILGVTAAPFPCAEHACGCASAHACWTDCCCFDRLEKIRWALERQIDPPATAHVTAAELAAAREVESTATTHACCAASAKQTPDTGPTARRCRDDATWHHLGTLIALPAARASSNIDPLLPCGRLAATGSHQPEFHPPDPESPPPRRA